MPEELSFRERKAQQLGEERRTAEPVKRPPVREAAEPQETSMETPPAESESVQEDGYPELHDEQGPELELDSDDDEDLDDETPSATDEDDEDAERVNWEQRYKDTQAELTKVSMQRKELDSEHAEAMAANLQLKFDLEDRLTKAEQQGNFFMGNLSNQITHLEQQFNQGAIDPEKMAEARQYYQGLQQQRNQLQQYLEGVTSQREETERVRKQREAQIARARLQRTIPDWSQSKYQQMREYAQSRGYSPDEFNDVTDHRYFELLHDSMLLNSAGDTVTGVKRQTRQKPPRSGKNVDRAPNTGRRRESRARKDLHDNPNQRGRFAALKYEQLQRESGRR